jgi:hypothetical protein
MDNIYTQRERENIVQMACTVDCVLAINGELQSNGIYIYIYIHTHTENIVQMASRVNCVFEINGELMFIKKAFIR